MKKLLQLSKMLLVVLGLCMGANAWAEITETEIVNCNFNNGETLFTGTSRMTVDNDNNVKFICANNSQNGYSLATYNFSSDIGTDATAVKIEFAFYIPNVNASYRRFFTIGQADKRTGFGKQAYSTSGSIFAFGLARNSSTNYFSINGASTTAAASATNVLGEWARAEIYADFSEKTVNYKITSMDGETTYYNADNVAFSDETATYCNQLDFFDCQNDVISYLDNLIITKYVDDSKTATTYTVKYQNGNGVDLKDAAIYDTYVNDTYTASSADMATFYSADTNKKYVYASGNDNKTATSTANDNVITLVFNEYDKVAYTVKAKCDDTELATLASGNAYNDGSTTVYWNMFINVDNKWYETTSPYGKTITEAGNTDIIYTASDITYFVEGENMTKSRSAAATASGVEYSNGEAPRHYKQSYWYTDAVTTSGNYTVSFPYTYHTSSTTTSLALYIRASDGTTTLIENKELSGAGKYTKDIYMEAGSSFQISNETEYNSNYLIDYVTLTGSSEAITISSDHGVASYVTTFPLDFSNVDGIKAYIATTTTTATTNTTTEEHKVVLENVTEVPAGTPIIVKGTKGTYNIPVCDYSGVIEGNLLKGSVTEENRHTVASGDSIYALRISTGKMHFVNEGVTIPAKKAYLDLTNIGSGNAKEFSFAFIEDNEEATAITTTTTDSKKAATRFFNAAGQQVGAGYKGMVIDENGNKYIK